jgi:asparagine synthetase B (glutamine-hydrolysing)
VWHPRDDHAAEPRYRSRPFVCGAIGAWNPALVHALTGRAPVPLRRTVERADLVLCSSGPTERWRAGERTGHCWGDLADGPAPSTWRDAAEGRLAGGVELAPDRVAVHTDALGVQDLYYRRVDGAVYFAGRIEPLLAIGPGPLHLDWTAWACTFGLTSPVGDATPFAEIRRLPAAAAWVHGPRGLALDTFEPSWTANEADPGHRAADVVDALRRTLRVPRGTGITLSGGWDSRLLAVLASRHRPRMRAWTTDADDGTDRDLRYSRLVAEALDMRHRILVPDPDWAAERAEVRRRTEYQTVHHTWIMPLARTLHRRRSPLLDGLAGDVLFKTSRVSDALLAETDPDRQVRLLWEGMEGKRLRDDLFLRDGLKEDFAARSRDAFTTAMAPFAGHHAAATLGKLHTRAVRAIAPSPMWLMAPDLRVELPFLHPEVIAAALRVPLDRKLDGAFYRQMLEAADPRVAALPSTNDPQPSTPRGQRRQRNETSAATLAALAVEVRSSEFVTGLLSPKGRRELLDPDALAATRAPLRAWRVLNWGGMLAQWLERYGSHLAVEDLPGRPR